MTETNRCYRGEIMSKAKAFGYIKVSGTEDQKAEKQKEAIERFASERDIEIVRIYQDNGWTRTILENSTLATLLLDLEENDQGIKMVMVEKLDQLAQDLTVQAAIMCELKLQGFQVVSALEESLWNFLDQPPGCSN